MSEVVPLFGRDKRKPKPEILCAECGRAIQRQRWAAWRGRMTTVAQQVLILSLLLFTGAYWILAALVLLGVFDPVYGGIVWLAGAGFVIFHMIRLLALVIGWLTGAPATIIEHRHVQQEAAHQEHRR